MTGLYNDSDFLMQFVHAIAKTVEAKDRYTSGHSERVAKYALEIAKRMGKTEEEQKEIYICGLLHDVGKIRIPGAIINKDTGLTDEEFGVIKLHPNAGYHILKDIDAIPSISDGARYHHERYDGKGYPNGLVGESIPEIARIIAVADCYDAMSSNRSYRSALPQDKVRAEMEKSKGNQLDPIFADIMIQIIDDDAEYALREPDATVKKVLIIDDEKMNRLQVKHLLKGNERYETLEAPSGMEGVNQILNNKIDLVLLDIRMPDKDGFETLEMIRSVAGDIPVIFLTADNDIDTINKAAKVGVKDYLVKPVMKNALLDMMQNALAYKEE